MHRKKINIFKLLNVFLIVCLAISIGYITKEKLSENKRQNGIEHIYSHRGASGEEIEHTFAAYDLAIGYGSKYIEQDLVTSKDGTLFVSHDLSAKRITGVEKDFNKMTDDEINQLKTKNGENIHSLDEVFERYKDSIQYVIQLKQEKPQLESFKSEVLKHRLEENIIVQTSTEKELEVISKTFPKMKKLLLIGNQEDLDLHLNSSFIDILGCTKQLMTKENIEAIQRHNKEANFWTLNTTEEINTAIQLNADSYFTDFTSKAILLEKKRLSKDYSNSL